MDINADVDAMRRTAAALTDRSARLRELGARLDAQLATMSYAGPSADRFRATIDDRRNAVGMAASRIDGLSDTVNRAAQTAAQSAALYPGGGSAVL